MNFNTKASELKKVLLKKYRLKKYTNKAHDIRKQVIDKTGREVVNRTVKNEIREYSNETFGSPKFWPWLSLYTEIRGEFIHGWLPNDYFQITLLDEWNPRKFSEISDMKTFYHSYYEDFAVKPVAVKVSGVYYDQHWNVITRDILIDTIRATVEEIVVKKDGGFAGNDIQFLKTEELHIRDMEKDNENLVIQPVIQQHSVLSKLHSDSLNTLRIATFLETDGSVAFKFMFLRFGKDGNRVDNAYSGGRLCFLNLEGEPLTGVMNSIGLTVDQEEPKLAKLIESLKIPSAEDAVNECIRHHSLFPYVRYIAWDVCIDSNSKPKMIEWNAIRPGMWFAEPHIGPIWDLDSILS